MARSGWRKQEIPERLSDHVSLGVLTKVFPVETVDRVIARVGAGEQRSRLLPSRVMVYYVLALALWAQDSYEEVMRSLLQGLGWLTGRFGTWEMPSAPGIFQARRRLGSQVVKELFQEVAVPVGGVSGVGFLGPWRMVSIDGTVLDVPDSVKNEETFGRPGTKTEFKSAYPQVKVVGLVECATHTVLAASLGGCLVGERELAREGVLEYLDDSMVMIADRGFFSFDLWQDCVSSGAQLLWRMKANSVLPVVEELPDGSYLSAIFPTPKARRRGVDGIRVRVVEYQVTEAASRGASAAQGGASDAAAAYVLITTITDPKQATAAQLADTYGKRWEIETCFDELKTHQRGQAAVLRSKTPDGVEQEVWGYLCVHYAIRSLIAEVADDFGEGALRFSFIRTLRAVRRSVTAAVSDFSPSGEVESRHR
jgi:hypothetical protein